MTKYRLVLEGVRLEDMAAVAALADEKGIKFDSIQKVSTGRVRHRRGNYSSSGGNSKIVIGKLLSSRKIGDTITFATVEKEMATVGMNKSGASALISIMKKNKKIEKTGPFLWKVIDNNHNDVALR